MRRPSIAFLLLLLTACSNSTPGNTDLPATLAAGEEALENAATGTTGYYLYLSELKLDPEADLGEGNHAWRSRTVAWPQPLAGAEFGFYDTKKMLRQFGTEKLIEMQQASLHVTFVADLDRDGEAETYRTGWFRTPDRDGQFLAVYEDGRLRDVWTHDDSSVVLRIKSWYRDGPHLFTANHPSNAKLVYRGDKLRMTWVERSLDR